MHRQRKSLLYLLFSLSGACALVYEVLWSKYLSLVFGTTIWAVSIVTATFMGGLALGSYLAGRYTVTCNRNLLRIYALLEAGIALAALAFPPTLNVVKALYLFWVRTLPDLPFLTTSCHLLFSAALLLPPAACMGGTFPVMCRLFARHKCGGQIGRLYALNTAGATIGALGAGYWLIPEYGLSLTGYLAMTANLLIAAGAFWVSRRLSGENVEAPPRSREWTLRPAEHRPILIAITLAGFVALAYEILWTRALLLFLGNTVYAFSLMLSAYLVGIALGGLLYARLVRPHMEEKRLFCTMAILAGVAVLATAPFYDQLAYAFQAAHEIAGERWWLLSLLSFGIVFLVLAVPTILSGALLPAAVAILDPGQQHTGEGVGLVVLHNTLGGVLGSLAAGFLLLPAIGILASFRLLAAVNILLGIALMYRYRLGAPVQQWIQVAGCVGAIVVSLNFSWDAKLLNSGIYCYAAKISEAGGLAAWLADETVLDLREGVEATVAVHQTANGNVRYFTVNGKTDGGTGRDMTTQVLVGQLPLLLHPEPRDVFLVGLGTGISLGGIKAHPVERIDCAEISPEVVAASHYFRTENREALGDVRVRLTVEDARNALLTDDHRYDVIVSQPSNPWLSGNANFFTSEFYRLARERLRYGGIFCQWVGIYDIDTEHLRLVFRTLLDSFSSVLLFHSESDLLLVASTGDLVMDYREMQRRMAVPDVAWTLAGIGVNSPGELIAGHYLFCQDGLRRFAGEGPINSDTRPCLEFAARYNLGNNMHGVFQQRNMEALMARAGRESLPLKNLGTTRREVALALRDLAQGFDANGRRAEAEYFEREAKSLLR